MLGDENVVIGFLGLLNSPDDLGRIGDARRAGIRILQGLKPNKRSH